MLHHSESQTISAASTLSNHQIVIDTREVLVFLDVDSQNGTGLELRPELPAFRFEARFT